MDLPFVNREKELAFLREHVDLASRGTGGAVILKGSTGTGKTRLCAEILSYASQSGFKTISGWCVSPNVQPLLAFEDALRCAGLDHLIEEGKPPRIEGAYIVISQKLMWSIERERIRAEEVAYAKVRNFALSLPCPDPKSPMPLETKKYGNYEIINFYSQDVNLRVIVYGKVREALVRDLQQIIEQYLLDKKIEALKSGLVALMRSGRYDGIDWAQGMHDAKKLNLFENVLLGIKRFAEKQPVIIFIDDLHLGDSTTIDLFLYIARNLKNARVLLLGTLNTEPGLLPENWDAALKQIEVDESVKIIALENLPKDKIVFSSLLGINLPPEAENLLFERTGGNPLFIAEYVHYLKENYAITSPEELLKILKDPKLPDTLTSLVLTRFEKLEKRERDLCTALAVARFGEVSVLAEICGCYVEEIDQALGGLKEKGILVLQGDIWKFVNSTFAEAIYASITRKRKNFLHRRALEALLAQHSKNERYFGEILRHALLLENSQLVLEYGMKAGESAMARYSLNEALEFFLSALKVANPENKKALIPKILEAMDILSMHDESIALIESELKEAREPVEKAKLLRRKAEILIKKGEYLEGMEFAREALRILEGRKERNEEVARIYSVMGILCERRGAYTDALRWEGKALKILEGLEGVESLLSFVYNRMGVVCWQIGDYRTSELYYQKSLEFAQRKNDLVAMSRCYNNLGVLFRNRGEPAKALEFYLKSMEIDEKIGDRWGIAGTCNNIGIVFHEMGNIPESLKYYSKALSIEREVGDAWGTALLHNNIGIGYFEMGEMEKALEHYHNALRIYERIGDTKGRAIVYNNLGDLYNARGDTETAREYYTRSAELCRNIGSHDFLFNALHGLVETALSSSAIYYCEEKLSELQEIANRLSDRKKIMMAKALKARLEALKGNVDEARHLFLEAEKNLEETAELIELAKVKFHHGMFEVKLGEKEEGKKLLENALEMFSKFCMREWEKRTQLALRMV